ncbi:MAG: GNAT family N-acetyltransferase [Pseudomonadota bacterium]
MMTDGAFIIRDAKADDLPACAQIVNDWVDASPWIKRVLSHEETAALFTPDLLTKRLLIVAESDDEVVGYLSLEKEKAYIHGFYISDRARGHGVGKALMDGAKQRCPEKLELSVFEPNAAAIRFYKREGFEEVPEGRKAETEEGVPTLLMRWSGSA